MLFVVIGHDGPNGAVLRPKVRPAHLEKWRPLANAGRIVIGGPFTDGSGSMVVADFANQAEAEAFARSDPYLTEGVFERVEVRPYRKVLPE